MLKYILIFFITISPFNYSYSDALDAFLTGVLKSLNKNLQKNNIKDQVKGSKSDYKILDKFSGCINYVESQSKYKKLNTKSPFPSKMNISHLTDKSYPTNNEMDMIIAYIQEAEECIKRPDANAIKNRSVKSMYLTSQNI